MRKNIYYPKMVKKIIIMLNKLFNKIGKLIESLRLFIRNYEDNKFIEMYDGSFHTTIGVWQFINDSRI
jgi:hypothetical protein